MQIVFYERISIDKREMLRIDQEQYCLKISLLHLVD